MNGSISETLFFFEYKNFLNPFCFLYGKQKGFCIFTMNSLFYWNRKHY